MRVISFLGCPFGLILCALQVTAQDMSEYPIRLKKIERIHLAAYDDTTRALATLFLVKRHKIVGPLSPGDAERYLIGFNMEACWITFGVSSVLFTAGLVAGSKQDNSSEDQNFNFILPLIGAMGMIGSGITLGIQYILLTPYTVKKYFKLLKTYQAGNRLPGYYEKRLTKYLR